MDGAIVRRHGNWYAAYEAEEGEEPVLLWRPDEGDLPAHPARDPEGWFDIDSRSEGEDDEALFAVLTR